MTSMFFWQNPVSLCLASFLYSNAKLSCYSRYLLISSVQFSSVSQLCPTLWDPMNWSTPGLPVHHQLPEFQTHWVNSIESVMPSNHLILCHTLLLLPSSFSSIRVFSNESVLYFIKNKSLFYLKKNHASILSNSIFTPEKELNYQSNGRKNIRLHALVYIIRFKIRCFCIINLKQNTIYFVYHMIDTKQTYPWK